SQKLDFLKKIDRNAAAAAVSAAPTAAAGAGSGAHVASAAKIFEALNERLKKNPHLAKEVDAKLTFKVKGPDASATFELGKAVTTITISDEDLTALAKGETTAK